MLTILSKYYNYYTSTDSKISETEDSFAMFADFEGVSGGTVITISILCFLHFRYPILSVGMSFISNISAALPSFFGFFVLCFGIILGFFCVTILPYILLHSYIRFIYWAILGFFKKFENSYCWRQHLPYQLVGWSKTANSLFGNEYTWQDYEIIFELHSQESRAYFEDIFNIYFQNLHKKYYLTEGFDSRKAWEFNASTGIMSGSLNAEYLKVFHNLLKYDFTKTSIEIKRVVFIPKDDSCFVQKYHYESSGGGG